MCLMHPSNLGEKVFIGYVNKRSLRVVTVQFTPVRAIAGMEIGRPASRCLVAFERPRTEKRIEETEK